MDPFMYAHLKSGSGARGEETRHKSASTIIIFKTNYTVMVNKPFIPCICVVIH